jgi:hypothetical protein
MSDRHDLRRQTREIHEALSRFDREQLADILTHIFRLYVMEGAALAPPPPASLNDELQGGSFAQLIERLQLRLDLPELQLFEVQGSRVSVRVDGRLVPLESPTTRAEAPALARPAAPQSSPAATSTPPPPASPGIEMRETRLQQAPPPPGVMPASQPSSARPEAAAPRSGARVSGNPIAGNAGGGPAERRPSGPAPGAPAPAPVPSPAKPDSKSNDEPGQGGRFGLLEID